MYILVSAYEKNTGTVKSYRKVKIFRITQCYLFCFFMLAMFVLK